LEIHSIQIQYTEKTMHIHGGVSDLPRSIETPDNYDDY
jgi:hypothetical protein